MNCIRFLLALPLFLGLAIASACCAAQGPVPENLRNMVQHATAFLEDMGDPSDRQAAQKIRDLMAAGNIRVGVIASDADTSSMAWTDYGVIYVNPGHIGRSDPNTRAGWGRMFQLARTLTHEVVHVHQGQDYVNHSDSFMNRTIMKNSHIAEVEGWGVGVSNATRWFDRLEKRLSGMSPADRARWAAWLDEEAETLDGTFTDFLNAQYLRGPFDELRWQSPHGGVFRTETEARKFIADFRARMREIMRLAGASPASAIPGGAPSPAAQGWAVYLITNYGGPGSLAPGGYVAVGGPGYETNPPLLSSFRGGGQNPQLRAAPSRVSKTFPSREDAVRSVCAQVTGFFRHPLARFIQMASYQGKTVGVDEVFAQLCAPPAGR